MDSISRLSNMVKSSDVVKSSKYLSNLTGATKQVAKTKLDDAGNALAKAKAKNVDLKVLDDQLSTIGKQLSNVDDHLPGDIVDKVKDATKNLEYAGIKNKSLVERRQNQGTLKNLFDRESARAQKEMNQAEKNLSKLKNKKGKLEQRTVNDLNVEMDMTKAWKKQLEDTSGITDMNQKVQDMQSAYDKATRATRRTRMATIGGIGATGYGVNKALSQPKNDGQNEMMGNYYSTGLNNNF